MLYAIILDLISLEAFKHLIKLTTSKRKKDTLLHILLSVKVSARCTCIVIFHCIK